MGKVFTALDDRLTNWLTAQHMFVVATAPSGDGGHLNASPKGLDTFRILSPTRVAYLDFVGSGAETIAHLRQNGRIVLMFCAVSGPPLIVRLYGRGRVVEPPDAGWAELRALFPSVAPARAVIVADLTRISDSCGWGVPLMEFKEHRPQMEESSLKKGEEGLRIYQREKNAKSLDGLPALRWVEEAGRGK